MAATAPTDFASLWQMVCEAPNHRSPFSIHGPDHWQRVLRNGRILSTRTGANLEIVQLFALFHDSKRLHDGWDPGHGKRGAEYAATLRGTWLHLSDDDFEVLRYACEWHTDGHHHDDPTIGTCWDADRLDLIRCGTVPEASFMSTDFGKEIADHGSIGPWLGLANVM